MKKGRTIGGVRRAQLITTYGVGALVAVGSESFMVGGLDRWPEPGPYDQLIQEPRLEKRFGVNFFRLPPASDSDKYGDVPVVRFPEIQSCPGCNRLARSRFFGAARSPAKCRDCDRELAPSRFVVCCANGHIDDFPYFRWLHKGVDIPDDGHDLMLRATGRSASLGDIEISCMCRVRPVTMEGALSKGALKGIATCTGRRPWLGDVPPQECNELPRAMQRGAAGAWFADVHSAISIPRWSERVHRLVGRHWLSLRNASDLRDRIEELGLAGKDSVDEIVDAVLWRREYEAGHTDVSQDAVKKDEYRALERGAMEKSHEDEFVCEPWNDEDVASELAIDKVMRVKRLREVRVLQGFTRLVAPTPADPSRVAKLYHESETLDWLPAIEVIGEGVFLRLDATRLARWEARPDVMVRGDSIDAAYRERFTQPNLTPPRQITSRLVMTHTLAHAIINEWSLDSGYPAASLRERLYVSDVMAGLLIYTASSDSAGSLGGIVAQVESGTLAASIRAALHRVAWCSADPLCIETDAAGTDNLNRAACHACVLLPETSCEEFNTLLDRALLIGTPDQPDLGFFKSIQ